jgi:hypothetical protein
MLLAKDPARRYATPEAAAKALEAILAVQVAAPVSGGGSGGSGRGEGGPHLFGSAGGEDLLAQLLEVGLASLHLFQQIQQLRRLR